MANGKGHHPNVNFEYIYNRTVAVSYMYIMLVVKKSHKIILLSVTSRPKLTK